jgi:hypothetical protein
MCLTDLSKSPDGSLIATCTMPCLEVGTVGGGTILLPQHSVLEVICNCMDKLVSFLYYRCSDVVTTHPNDYLVTMQSV